MGLSFGCGISACAAAPGCGDATAFFQYETGFQLRCNQQGAQQNNTQPQGYKRDDGATPGETDLVLGLDRRDVHGQRVRKGGRSSDAERVALEVTLLSRQLDLGACIELVLEMRRRRPVLSSQPVVIAQVAVQSVDLVNVAGRVHVDEQLLQRAFRELVSDDATPLDQPRLH